MDISKENIKNFVETLVFKKGESGAVDFLQTADYPHDVKEYALSLIQKKKPDASAVVENGDISDFGN